MNQPLPPNPVSADWYVGYTKQRLEAQARDNLARQGFEVYLPFYKVFKRGQPDGVCEPMFPRYLLLRPQHPGRSLSVVRSTVGMVGLVRFGEAPATLPDAVVRTIRAREAERAAASRDVLVPFTADQAVRLVGGPLAGLAGVVHSVASQRVTVLLEMLGRPTRVVVAAEQLAAA